MFHKDMVASSLQSSVESSAPLNGRGYRCRFCSTPLKHTFVDLGTAPPCQRHVTPARFDHAEATYPLHAFVCHNCFLVQVPAYLRADELFDDQYAYFSSYSTSWLTHCEKYANAMIDRLKLNQNSLVVELASNDGYLLQYFVKKNVPVLGIEPTANTAAEAEKRGVRSLVKFFGAQTARDAGEQYGKASLIAANNVLAHVPDINDFVAGMKVLLAEQGTITVEFPHLLRLIEQNQFDTIYHEHYSYLGFATVARIFEAHGLRLFDVDELATHGGSLRIYGCHQSDPRPNTPAVASMVESERAFGLFDLERYARFAQQVIETKQSLLSFLIEAKKQGKRIVGYGAPGKGNTLLNYCGVRTDFIDYTVDRSPHKQGNYLPGSRIPILHPDRIFQDKPDFVLILPWNLRDEITHQMAGIREWGGRFVVPIPRVEVLS